MGICMRVKKRLVFVRRASTRKPILSCLGRIGSLEGVWSKLPNKSLHQTKPLATPRAYARPAPTDFSGEAIVRQRCFLHKSPQQPEYIAVGVRFGKEVSCRPTAALQS